MARKHPIFSRILTAGALAIVSALGFTSCKVRQAQTAQREPQPQQKPPKEVVRPPRDGAVAMYGTPYRPFRVKETVPVERDELKRNR